MDETQFKEALIDKKSFSKFLIRTKEEHHEMVKRILASVFDVESVGDWIVDIGLESVANLETLGRFSSIATFTRENSAKLILISDVDAILDNKSGSKHLISFLRSTPRKIKTFVLMSPETSTRHKKNKSLLLTLCDCNYTFRPLFVENVTVISVQDIIDRKFSTLHRESREKRRENRELTREELDTLVGHRVESIDLLWSLMNKKFNTKSNTLKFIKRDYDLARSMVEVPSMPHAQANFDDNIHDITATLRILAIKEFLD